MKIINIIYTIIILNNIYSSILLYYSNKNYLKMLVRRIPLCAAAFAPEQ